MGNMNSSEKTRLDRIEEKITNLDETTRIILKRMVAQEERLRHVEQQQADAEGTLKTVKSIAWTFVSAIITGLGGAILWMIGFPADK